MENCRAGVLACTKRGHIGARYRPGIILSKEHHTCQVKCDAPTAPLPMKDAGTAGSARGGPQAPKSAPQPGPTQTGAGLTQSGSTNRFCEGCPRDRIFPWVSNTKAATRRTRAAERIGLKRLAEPELGGPVERSRCKSAGLFRPTCAASDRAAGRIEQYGGRIKMRWHPSERCLGACE